MFDTYSDYDPVAPAADALLAELGIDARHVRDALADDMSRRCPEHGAASNRHADAGDSGAIIAF